MLANVARRAAATQARRNLSTAAKTEKFPYKGIADGGHLPQLQAEPSFTGYWVNFKAFPEVVPVAACVGFACALGAYKTFVVDGANVPFVDRASQFEK